MRRVAPLVLATLPLGGLGLAMAACEEATAYFHPLDAGIDAVMDAGGECSASKCVQKPGDWDGPFLLRSGPHDLPLGSDLDGGVTACPYGGEHAFNGGDGLVALTDCEPCICGPSTGSCSLPSTMTAHNVLCQNLGQPHQDIPFNAPVGWNGGCDSMDPINAGSGIQSISIEPVTVKNEFCGVGPAVPGRKLGEPHWTTDAFTCHVQGWNECNGDPDSRCIPLQPPEGFRVCISYPGDNIPCDIPPWTEHAFFYGHYVDHRDCSDYSCGPPMGSGCSSAISIYSDNMCQAWLASNTVTQAPNFCANVPPGVALKSKLATAPVYTPGMCIPSGGVPNGGTAEPIQPTTFCCLP